MFTKLYLAQYSNSWEWLWTWQAPGLKANTPSPPPNNGASRRQGRVLQEILLFESLFAGCAYGSSIHQEDVNLQDFIPRQKRGSDKIWGIKCGVERKDMVKKPLIFDGFIYWNDLFSLQNTIHSFFYIKCTNLQILLIGWGAFQSSIFFFCNEPLSLTY